MDINKWLDRQKALQEAFGFPTVASSNKDKAGLLHMYTVGAIKEISEMMDEFSWKPWAKGSFVNSELVLSEVVDTFFFLLNIVNTIGATEEDMELAMMRKLRKNQIRASSEYDNDYMKCIKCNRALDDFYEPEEVLSQCIVVCKICEDK